MLRGWFAAGMTLFGSGLALSVALSSHGPTWLDRRARTLALRVRRRPLTQLAEALAVVAEPGAVLSASALATVLARTTDARARIASAGFLRIALEKACKHVFSRHRPPPRLQIGVQRGCSLPSGHSLAIVPLFTMANETGKPSARAAAIAFSVLVGVSRIYLGKHNATDVAAGLLMGAGAACLLESTRATRPANAPA
jgi:undecaprenyl-diphosphatase